MIAFQWSWAHFQPNCAVAIIPGPNGPFGKDQAPSWTEALPFGCAKMAQEGAHQAGFQEGDVTE